MKLRVDNSTGNTHVVFNTGNTLEHDRYGAIFKSVVTPHTAGSTTHTHYKNLLPDTLDPEVKKNILTALTKGIETGIWEGDAKYALVRFGSSECWRYFPIPLLFENNDTIRAESRKVNRPPHADGWYRHKRNLVLKLVGIPMIP